MLKLVPPRAGKTPYWYVRGTYLGQSVDRSTKSTERRVAVQTRDKIKAEIERGEFAKPGEPTFLSAAVGYMKAGGERRFVQPLLTHFRDKALKQIGQAEIDQAAYALYPKATPATRNRQVYTPMSAILKHAKIEAKIRRPKGAGGEEKTDWLWPEQAFKLFRTADTEDPEFGLFLRVLCYTGMRLSEALNMEIDRTRLAESFAFVCKTKNDEPRPVFLPPVVVAALGNHPRGMERGGERVFRFGKGGRLYRMLSKAAAEAGIALPKRQAFHLLRHTWATWMRRYGRLDTKGLVGTGAWKDRRSASRYEHVVASEEAERAIHLPTEKTARRGKSVEKRSARR